MSAVFPGEVEIYGYFSQHLGPRFEAAGLRVQFHLNQEPGIHFKTPPPEEYKDAILRGLKEGLETHFARFPDSASLWITEITEHEVDSSQRAFYRAGLMVIDQAFSIYSHQK